jgi:dethiobiotin synthetase
MTQAYFVTGTDTGVGKTTVSAGILAALRRRGHPVAALKPVETGCSRGPTGELVPSDALLLRAAAGRDDLPLASVVPYLYPLPITPAVAARREGVPISLPAIHAAYASLRALRPRLLLVEGAGGLLSPLTDDHLGADLAHELDLPLLVIARASLGTLNHTLLTLHEAESRGLAVAGVVLSRTLDARGPDEDTNLTELRRLTRVPVLGVLEHLPLAHQRDLACLADAIDAALDPTILLASQATSA